ncbi:MAG: NAD(P)-dependent oxidoreductase [Lentisphaerae bacterium]|nr:NAD(P)-dependent oxidoreductase [Lentisphaerota bacterium]
MNALIIGSEGNIGAPLVRHLREQGHRVLEADIRQGWRPDYLMADINHPVDLLPAFDWGPDVVFLLSAMVSRVTCEQASGLAVATNLAGINNVLQLCRRGRCRLVFFSTSEVYGPQEGPLHEERARLEPNNRYGLTKLLGERLVEYEVRSHGLRAVTLRPFMIYDEHEDIGDHRSAMIRFAYNLSHGRPIEVHRGCRRGWLHISDAVRMIGKAASVDAYMAINIGSPELVSIEALAEQIRSELGAPRELLHAVDQPERMTPVKIPDLDRQTRVLGEVPRVPLAEGVRRVCAAVRALP